MGKWTFEELRQLCQKKGILDSTVYQNSLDWRHQRALFHRDTAKGTWDNLFKQGFTWGDERYAEAAFKYEAHVESCVQSLHSLADILSQIVNITLLNNVFSEEDVSIKKVTKELQKQGQAPNVVAKLSNLLNSYTFCYIEAFCNTIKHRRFILTELRSEYGGNYRNETGLIFDGFQYKGVTYPPTWGSEIIGPYRDKIFELIVEVGIEINDFLR